jgi:peptidoglycan/xylan/chitin deacetylase (PgdA/CDA1 family)
MRNNNEKLLVAFIISSLFFISARCDGTGNYGSNGEYNLITKESIEMYIDDHWQEYGYSAKPSKFIALSFDDGPCPSSSYGGTEALLRVLAEQKVRATFFVIGSQVLRNKTAAQAIFEAGHELGNHSNAWDSLGGSNVEVIRTSLSSASNAIKEITGKYPVLFRAPNLSHGANLSQVCKDMGMALIDGNAHNDWPGNSELIKTSVLANPSDGGIIILHENNTSRGNTLAVLAEIISGLREKGFWIMTVSELAIVKGKKLEAGSRYSSL